MRPIRVAAWFKVRTFFGLSLGSWTGISLGAIGAIMLFRAASCCPG